MFVDLEPWESLELLYALDERERAGRVLPPTRPRELFQKLKEAAIAAIWTESDVARLFPQAEVL